MDSVLSLFSLDETDMIWVDTRSFEYRLVCSEGPHIHTHMRCHTWRTTKMYLDDVKTSQLSHTPLDTHPEKGEGVNKKKSTDRKKGL